MWSCGSGQRPLVGALGSGVYRGWVQIAHNTLENAQAWVHLRAPDCLFWGRSSIWVLKAPQLVLMHSAYPAGKSQQGKWVWNSPPGHIPISGAGESEDRSSAVLRQGSSVNVSKRSCFQSGHAGPVYALPGQRACQLPGQPFLDNCEDQKSFLVK